jgi:hypothetical protein
MRKYALKMLSQPSTYAGFSAIALALGVSQPVYAAVSALAAAVFGVIAVVVDGKPDDQPRLPGF